MRTTAATSTHPNIIFVLTDDLSTDLLPYLPHVQALAGRGVKFSNYTVTDSLCCPSRSSIFTGNFPHNTHVFNNTAPEGGFTVFNGRGEESSTTGTDLQAAGYRTAMMGKYLNGYEPDDKQGDEQNYVPPGWNEWDVAGEGYNEFNYDLNENHKVVHHGRDDADYMTDVLSRKASAFVDSSVAAHKPFYAEIATFAPHKPYAPAPRYADSYPDLDAPRDARFDKLPTDAPNWLAHRTPLTQSEIDGLDLGFRKRVRSVLAVDDMLASIEKTLDDDGVADDTDIVFSSDNGFHLGQYRLIAGKMTAFDSDIKVPLIAAGPGIASGVVMPQPAENIDLRATFDQLAGTNAPANSDGHTLVPLLDGEEPATWRRTALIEHHGPGADTAQERKTDPDYQTAGAADPPSYDALRTAAYTYVEYSTGELEYYDRVNDPDEMHNVAGTLPESRLTALHDQLVALRTCHGQSACWTAAGA